jgi:hypothetical protein
VAVVQRVLREGPECIGNLAAGVQFWADVWEAVHLEEIYVEIAAPASLRVAPSADVHLDELVDELPEWTRVHMFHRGRRELRPDPAAPALRAHPRRAGPLCGPTSARYALVS